MTSIEPKSQKRTTKQVRMEQIVPQIRRSLQSKYSHMMIRWYEAVDWQEPLIIGAICAHALLFLAVIFARKRLSLQFGLFVVIMLLLFVTEPLNKWGQNNWRLFATQNYFDPHGVFMGIFYAGPLLAAGFFQLVNAPRLNSTNKESLLLSMKNMVQMIILVKRAEFREHHKKLKQQSNSSKPKNE